MLPLLPLAALVFLWGCLRPLYHTAIHQAIDDADRTTLVSAENLLANLLEAVVGGAPPAPPSPPTLPPLACTRILSPSRDGLGLGCKLRAFAGV